MKLQIKGKVFAIPREGKRKIDSTKRGEELLNMPAQDTEGRAAARRV